MCGSRERGHSRHGVSQDLSSFVFFSVLRKISSLVPWSVQQQIQPCPDPCAPGFSPSENLEQKMSLKVRQPGRSHRFHLKPSLVRPGVELSVLLRPMATSSELSLLILCSPPALIVHGSYCSLTPPGNSKSYMLVSGGEKRLGSQGSRHISINGSIPEPLL